MNITILVTGGAGFIGSHFIRHIFHTYPNYNIINLDILNYAANPAVLGEVAMSDRYRFLKADVCDLEAYYSLLADVDFVVHFAAQTHVDRSFDQVDEFIRTNVEGTEKLLLAMKNIERIKTFVHVSTDEVYGPIADGYALESDVLNPTNPYAKTKATAERSVQKFMTESNISSIIVRPSNNFGPNQNEEKFVPKAIIGALSDFSIPLYGDGEYYREWIYVEDCVRAIDLVLHQGYTGEIYNIGSDKIWSNFDLAQHILKLANKSQGLINFVKNRPIHDRRYAMDCSKITALGFEIDTDFDYCLLRTLEYYLDEMSG